MGNVNKYGDLAGVTFATIYAISVACPSDSTDGIALYWHALEVERTGHLIGKGLRGLMVAGPLIANALACFESWTSPGLRRRVHGAKLMVGWMVGGRWPSIHTMPYHIIPYHTTPRGHPSEPWQPGITGRNDRCLPTAAHCPYTSCITHIDFRPLHFQCLLFFQTFLKLTYKL